MQSVYPPPLDRLLTLGRPAEEILVRSPPGYYAALGLTADHRETLLRMALDEGMNFGDPDSTEVWAPLHAWRALCELHIVESVLPLTQLWEDEENDWAHEDLEELFPDFGAAALGPMLTVLDDPRRNRWARMSAAIVIERIGERHAELRNECVAHLAERLERYAHLTPELNSMLVNGLVELKAVECAPLIKRAFDADMVDPLLRGDWVDVEFDLGLRTDQPAGRSGRMFGRTLEWGPSPEQFAYGMTPAERTAQRKQRAKQEAKAKEQRKRAKKLRRRNRR